MVNNKNKASLFSNLVLGSAAAGFILISIYIWHISNVQQAPFNIKLIGLLTGCALFCIVALLMRKTWKINLAVALFSTLVAVYSVELVLFFLHNARVTSTEIDTRNKLELLEDMRSEGIDAWPQVLSWLFIENNGLQSGKSRIFPLGGISQKTIVYCNESGKYKIFESDEHGFNNPEGLYSKGIIEVALVGDSFTIGSCVMSGEDIASLLRNRGIKALNLGNGGNGPLSELAVLKEYVEAIQPDIVLWIYYEGNDLLDLERERTASLLLQYLENKYTQNLLNRQDEIDSVLKNYVTSQWTKKRALHRTGPQEEYSETIDKSLFQVIKLWHLRSRLGLLNVSEEAQNPDRTTDFGTQLPLFSQILDIARKRTAAWGGKFYFVYLPTMERYVNNNNKDSFYNRGTVIALVRNLGIPLIDFHGALNSHPDPLSLTPFLGAHYNAKGYKLLTELIASKLRKDGLISQQ